VEQFWADFEEQVGEVGADPVSFYGFQLGHILHVLPEDVGELTPSDILGAYSMFDALYMNN
jgi:hypothetical protein